MGILVAVALPSYQSQRLRALHLSGMSALQMMAMSQSRHVHKHGAYQGRDALISAQPLPDNLSTHYELAVEVESAPAYFELMLKPKNADSWGGQIRELRLDSLGRRTNLSG